MDAPLFEVTLRKYEPPSGDRDRKIRIFLLSMGLIRPGDKKSPIETIFKELLGSEKPVSVPELAAQLYPWLPVRWLARFRYPTGEYVKRVPAPVLIIHSRDDEIIPFAQGRSLFSQAREPKHFLELRGGHNDGFLVSDQHYRGGLGAFLASVLDK